MDRGQERTAGHEPAVMEEIHASRDPTRATGRPARGPGQPRKGPKEGRGLEAAVQAGRDAAAGLGLAGTTPGAVEAPAAKPPRRATPLATDSEE